MLFLQLSVYFTFFSGFFKLIWALWRMYSSPEVCPDSLAFQWQINNMGKGQGAPPFFKKYTNERAKVSLLPLVSVVPFFTKGKMERERQRENDWNSSALCRDWDIVGPLTTKSHNTIFHICTHTRVQPAPSCACLQLKHIVDIKENEKAYCKWTNTYKKEFFLQVIILGH